MLPKHYGLCLILKVIYFFVGCFMFCPVDNMFIPFVFGKQMINYEDFLKVAREAGEKCR